MWPSPENSVWKRLWNCRENNCVIIIIIIIIITIINSIIITIIMDLPSLSNRCWVIKVLRQNVSVRQNYGQGHYFV